MSDQLPPLPDELRALLDAATPPAPSAGFEAKLLAKVSATLGMLPPGGGTPGAEGSGGGTPGAAASGGASMGGAAAGAAAAGPLVVTKATLLVAGLFLLGAGVAGGVVLGRTVLAPEAPPQVLAVAPPPVVAEPVRVDAPAEPAPVAVPQPQLDTPPTPPKPVAAKPVRPAEVPPKEPAPPASRDTQLSQERALLEVARTTLAKGDVAATLDAVGRHTRDFPDGRLAEEREVLFIQALVQADRRDEAVRRADAFRKKFPDSLMLPAVDAALAP